MKKLRVCCGRNCTANGSERIMQVVSEHFKIAPGEKNAEVDLDYTTCTDYCDFGPNIVENDEYIYHESKTKDIVERIERGDHKKIQHITFDDLQFDDDLLS